MRNPCLEAALRELNDAGIRDVTQSRGGKHLQIRWKVNGGEVERMYSMALTPSDHRAADNTRAHIRRILKEDGLSREQTTKAAVTVPKPSHRIAALEGRVAKLEHKLETLFAQLTNIGGHT